MTPEHPLSSTYASLVEPARLERLAATAMLDSPRDEHFDRLTRLAASAVDAPVALLTLVDGSHQFFKSAYGLQEPWATRRETPLSHSFCQYVVAKRAPVLIADARNDPEMAENRAIPEIGVVAYLGAPLETADGYVLGSFAVIDAKPREWSVAETMMVADFARVAITEIELRGELARSAENSRQHDAIFGRMPIGLVVVDAQGRVKFRNSAAEKIWHRELPVGEVVGDYFAKRSFTLEGEQLARDRWPLRRSLKFGETVVDEEVAIVPDDGRRRVLSVSVAPLGGEAGDPHGAIVVLDDVSDRVDLQSRVQNAQRLESVGRLAGGVAHDFNNILTVITAHADLIREAAGEGSSIGDDAAEVLSAADRAAALTRRLLTFSRNHVLNQTAFSVSDAIRSLEPMMRRLVPEDIELRFMYQSESGQVWADRAQFEQAVMNLVANARDAMPAGGKVTISIDRATLEAGSARPTLPGGSYVRIVVADTGVGMNAAVKAQVFDPFFTTKGPGAGTGLGLSTVMGFVTQTKGAVEVDTESGGGTAFTIWLPITKDDSPPVPVRSIAVGEKAAGGAVLLVEDEPAVRDAVGGMLRQLGYEVIPAEDATDAVLQLEEFHAPVDLILTDVVMPHAGGKELGDWAAAVIPSTPVLFMSGYTDDEVLLRGISRGEVAFIQKPFKRHQLAEAIARVLMQAPQGG